MSFASDTGYIPVSIEGLMDVIRQNVNEKFSMSYTTQTFLGTNWYKFFYSIIQRLQENEVKTSEIFNRMQEYFAITNEKVLRPNTTHPGIFDYFGLNGYFVSTKPPLDIDAGKAYVCVDVDETADDYPTQKLAICNLIKNCIVGGVVSQGTEVESITLSNGQSFDFKFNLPDRIPVEFRLTITLSENNLFAVDNPQVIRQRLFDNITAKYKLGKNFEPQRYFSVVDAPWAAMVLLEWTDDGGANWHDEIFESEYDEVFTFAITDIDVVEV